MEGEVEWDCLAEGKQGRGLLPKDSPKRGNAESKQIAAARFTERVKEGANDSTLKTETMVLDDSKEGPTVDDAYEFDEDELARIP